MSLEATQYSCSRNDVCQRVFEGDVGWFVKNTGIEDVWDKPDCWFICFWVELFVFSRNNSSFYDFAINGIINWKWTILFLKREENWWKSSQIWMNVCM